MVPTDVVTLAFSQINKADHARVGGKCASLGAMTQAGIAVPAGFAVTTDAYQALLNCDGLTDTITDHLSGIDRTDMDRLKQAATAIRAAIMATPLPETIQAAILRAYRSLGDDIPVAVRSSATAEDLPDASFAGQQDTYLWVIGDSNVVQKVRECWASLFTARAICYREENNIPHIDVLMSVAVQKMVNARCAGVAMSLDPLNGDRTKIVIESAWGLGETVVSGDVTPDSFRVEKVMMTVLGRQISDKHIELVGDPDARAAITRDIAGPRRTQPSLTDDEILAVAALTKKLEKLNACPQDVEWAMDADLPDGENLVALQSRPETVWSQRTQEPSRKTYMPGMAGIASTLTTPMAIKT